MAWEDWSSIPAELKTDKFEQWNEELYNIFRREDPTGFGMLSRFIVGIMERVDELEGQEAYGLIYAELLKCYNALKSNQDEFPHKWGRVNTIFHTMWKLENGFPQLFGDEIKMVTPDISEEEKEKRCKVYDRARVVFQEILENAFTQLELFSDRNLLILWARMVYYHVHGFQAPLRQDPNTAIEDAMGTSDHFNELLNRAIENSPEAVQLN